MVGGVSSETGSDSTRLPSDTSCLIHQLLKWPARPAPVLQLELPITIQREATICCNARTSSCCLSNTRPCTVCIKKAARTAATHRETQATSMPVPWPFVALLPLLCHASSIT